MATRGLFIGIDRYQSTFIRDLNGAARDATALYALLSDSIPEMEARLLRDREATHESVEAALRGLLLDAEGDDVLLIAFAGHGTQDHRLVLSDTEVENLPGTTIDMSFLAEAFRQSRARSVIFFRDCCFSGGATARVLDLGLVARGIALNDVAGDGRIMVAAAMPDQEAYEDPKSRHGLFTGAIIEVLSTAGERISVLNLFDRVQALVRANAGRMGYFQDPVIFGHVEGGLTLPAGRKGKCWLEHFPELANPDLTGPLEQLKGYGFPEQAIAAWKTLFPSLNSLQLQSVNECGVLAGNSLLVVAPTSAGKTFIGELAAVKTITEGKKAIFLLPYKALVNEKYEDFQLLYGEGMGLRVVRCSGDWQDQVGDVMKGKYDIAFFTYEKFLSMALGAPGMLNQIGIVVLDEAQFITEPGRGMSVELLLTQLIAARSRGVAPQIVCLSAVIGATRNFESWLGARLLMTDKRPVPLTEGVMDRTGAWLRITPEGLEGTEKLLDAVQIRQRRSEPSSQDMIVPLVKKLVADGEKVLVFRGSRGDALGAAGYLAAELGLGPANGALALLPDVDMSASSEELRAAMAGSVAFHHSDLNRDERLVVEHSFRQTDGVKVLVATSTLAAGINTPASTVIVVETDFPSGDGPLPYTVAQYKNMAGRAGRLGYEANGKAIVLANTPFEKTAKFKNYVLAQPEPISSSFDPSKPGTWILKLLTQVKKVKRSAVAELLANTYGGFLQSLSYPGWQASIAGQVDHLLDRMIQEELVADEDGTLQLTMLGNACGQSPLSLESALRLVSIFRRLPPALHEPKSLVVIVQALEEVDAVYTPQMRVGEPRWQNEAISSFGYDVVSLLRLGATDNKAFYARCKRACLLEAWLEGQALADIESSFSANSYSKVRSGDVNRCADTTRFILESGRQIAVALSSDAEIWAETDAILKQLETGLPSAGLHFTGAPLQLRRGEILGLLAHGVASPEDLHDLSLDELQAIIGNRANRVFEMLQKRRDRDAA